MDRSKRKKMIELDAHGKKNLIGGHKYTHIMEKSRFIIIGVFHQMLKGKNILTSIRVFLATLMLVRFIIANPIMLLFKSKKEIIYTIVSGWGKRLCKIAQYTINVINMPIINLERTYLFASNHQSSMDIPIIYATLPVLAGFVANRKLAQFPIIGHLIKEANGIFVERFDSVSQMQVFRQMVEHLKSGKNLILFPEGRMTDNGNLYEFQRGGLYSAVIADAIIIPICIKGSRESCMPGQFEIIPKLPISVTFGDPIDTKLVSNDDKKNINTVVFNAISKIKDQLVTNN